MFIKLQSVNMFILAGIISMVLFCFNIVITVDALYSSASFYGNSFTFEHLSDFSSDTTVSLQFQTQLHDGVLLIAAGQEDYFIISLKSDRLKIQINLGAGETVIQSPPGTRYNNLLWHKVDVLRIASRLDLRINGKDVASETVWTTDDDNVLEIDMGIFLGGYDLAVGATYLDKSVPFFRGCVLSATFNNRNILDPLHNIPNQKIVHNIEAGCTRLLRARRTEPMTFESVNAYLKYERWTKDDEGTFDCNLKTINDHGLVLYNVGWKRRGFVGLEMIGGTVRASMNKGAGVVGLQSTQPINDGRWHRIRFSFSSTLLEIKVDRNRTKVFIEQTDLHPDSDGDESVDEINLKGPLYVGGINGELKKHKNLLSTGLRLDSFPGCIKNIRINSRSKSLGDILESHDVSTGCETNQEFTPQLFRTDPPFFPTFVIVPRRPETSMEETEKDSTFSSNSENPVISDIARKLKQEVCYNLTIHDFEVIEDQSQNFTKEIINLETMKTNLRRLHSNNGLSVFNFKPISLPQSGNLYFDGNQLSLEESVPMKDVLSGRMIYRHDGSETLEDGFSFALSTLGRDRLIRQNDAKQYFICDENNHHISSSTSYNIHITVIPVDDPPHLHIPSRYVFHPIRNSKTPLPKEILTVIDEDSSPSEIIFHLLGIGTGQYVEKRSNPGRPINLFTQEDINLKNINFVHAGGPVYTRLLLQVSNNPSRNCGIQSSSVLRISSRPLVIEISNNTDFTLVEGEAKVLTRNHLSVDTNAGISIVDVRYTVQVHPDYGELQVLMGRDRSRGAWTRASSFLESQIGDGRVRYLNVDTSGQRTGIVQDRFFFSASASGSEVGPFDFNITILRVKVSLHLSPITLKAGRSTGLLNGDVISVLYTGVADVSKDEIQLVVLKKFQHSSVSYEESGLEVSTGDAFTLAELESDKLRVTVLTRQIDRNIPKLHDNLLLQAVVQARYRSHGQNLSLTYIPDTRSITVTSLKLLVDEGGEERITPDHLFAQTLLHRRFLFNVTKMPQHGVLRLRQLVTSSSSANDDDALIKAQTNVSSFTTRDIVDGRLHYRHDDSENDHDCFAFTAHPILDGELPDKVDSLRNATANGIFIISITLLNDNPPVRVINKPFNVVRNSKRLLTRRDLWYRDPDVNQDDLSLKYVRRGITNGDILNATSKRREQIFEFTQRDIESNSVLFRHKRRSFGRFVFWVKDGKHFATGLFIVQASSPYVRISNSSKLLVKRDSSVVVTTANVQADTNIVGRASLIRYRVLQPPMYGTLNVGNTTSISSFTQRQIDEGLIDYRHDGSPNMADYIGYSVTAGEKTVRGNLSIQIFLPSQQQPPVIRRNRVVSVQQGSSVKIRRSDLRATHQDIRPRDIKFTVRKKPKYGYFLLNRTTDFDGASSVVMNATVFSQWDVNQGHLIYVQSSNVSFNSPRPFDNYTCDVSNGILSLVGVVCQVEIVPFIIPLRAGNFSVREGRSKVLVREYLDVVSPHFENLDINLVVVRQPINGQLESSRDTGKRLTEFTFRLAKAEFVYYIHDGSDTVQDLYQLQATAADGSRHSDVVSTFVTVIPENDQPPSMENNTGLMVWINSTTTITSQHLAAIDLDSPPKNLTYEILPPDNGHVALVSKPSKSIATFSQAQIDSKEIVFVHKGKTTGGFTFQVDDHDNFDTKHIFVITAKPLVITIQPTQALKVFPSTYAQLTSDNLKATTNDKAVGPDARDVAYVITKQPAFGSVVKKSLKTSFKKSVNSSDTFFQQIDRFSQSDVDSGLVYFHQNKDPSSWSITDSFQVTAFSFPARNITGVILHLNISYDVYASVGRLSPIQVNKGGVVMEGGSFNLTSSRLDASNLLKMVTDTAKRKRYDLRYLLLSLPSHGELSVAGRVLSANDSFLHRFIERGIVRYAHDDSEQPTDSFIFKAYLQNRKHSGDLPAHSLQDTFQIQVQPVNDNPPKLQTRSPHLVAVQGFNAMLNSSMLRAVDLDNPATDIKYSIIRPPTHGVLKLISGNSTLQSPPITTFNQDDVNRGRVVFVQNKPGSTPKHFVGNEEISDAFYFGLTDGKHRPIYRLFIIKIKPVVLEISMSLLHLKQGQFSALLSDDVFVTSTNGDRRFITFHLEVDPMAGSLFNGNEKVTAFSFDDFITSRITYVMSDRYHASDHMTFMITYNDSRITDGCPNTTATLNITVDPLIRTAENMEILPGRRTMLNVVHFDASELANLTDSQPIYQLLEPPRYADVIVDGPAAITSPVERSLVRRSIAYTSFTHDDVLSGFVSLRVGSLNVTNSSVLKDRFKFRLTVENEAVQPAVGVFLFNIVPALADEGSFEEGTTAIATSPWITEESTGEWNVGSTTSPTPSVPLHTDSTASLTSTSSISPSLEVHNTPVIKEPEADSEVPWLIPLIVALCLLLLIFIAIAVVCFYKRKRKKRGPAYIRGQESATLKSSVAIPPPSPISAAPHQTTIDASTVVKVTSRAENNNLSQRCPTAPVVVTPLQKAPSDSLDDDPDDGYYGDVMMSNSMPLEGVLATPGMREPQINLPSRRFNDHSIEASCSMEFYNDPHHPSLDHYQYPPGLSSNESINSDKERCSTLPRRNSPSASYHGGGHQSTASSLGINQYWV